MAKKSTYVYIEFKSMRQASKCLEDYHIRQATMGPMYLARGRTKKPASRCSNA